MTIGYGFWPGRKSNFVTIQVGSTPAAGAGTARPRGLLMGGTNRGRAVPTPAAH
jgi:hypothetical protein